MNEPDSTGGVGPRAGVPLKELDRELPVRVEMVGDDLESGYTIVHDADYLEPHGEYVEMTLGDALDVADDLCCDCFTVGSLDE